MCFQVLLLLYSLLSRRSPAIGCRNVFNGTQFFFDSMDTASCRVDGPSQWERCAGSCLSDSAPGPRSSPPSLAASTRWLSGGVQNNNTAVSGLSALPGTCQHSWVLLLLAAVQGGAATAPSPSASHPDAESELWQPEPQPLHFSLSLSLAALWNISKTWFLKRRRDEKLKQQVQKPHLHSYI